MRSLAPPAIRVLLVVAVLFVAGCALLPGNATNKSDPAGCVALKFAERRCAAVIDRARRQAAIGDHQVSGVAVLPRVEGGDIRLGGGVIARVRFDFADGGSLTQEVFCQVVGGADDLACQENPKIGVSAGVDHDVPCAGEAPNGCATLPPTPAPAAIAAAQPLRVAALDIPLDHTGRYEVKVGEVGLPSGYLSRRQLRLVDDRPTTFWITDGIRLDVRPTVAGRPPIGSIYRLAFKGTEPADVFLVFEVTDTSPGAVLQVRDVVVE